MSKIWYCPNCGYEVPSRGRCHQCHQRLVASSLPELPAGEDEDEVGYRLDSWADRERGRLIEQLNFAEILHRFEDDELVVAAEDEARVDDLIAELADNPEENSLGEASWTGDGLAAGGGVGSEGDSVAAAVQLLADAAGRLRRDPTDMHADADVAEASAAVFMVDRYGDADEETWAAIGRVTRRLMSALGADEALEDEIRSQAAVLEKLLDPLAPLSAQAAAEAVDELASSGKPPNGAEPPPDDAGAVDVAAAPDARSPSDETVYELPEWLPEQRAQLSILLDHAGIPYEWDGGELAVPADRETDVEALFEQVSGLTGDEDDDDGGESRYHAIEELFAAADRLAGDPADEQRAAETVARIEEAAGPPPVGFDEIYWFRIMTQARTLSDSIEAERDEAVIAAEAAALRDLLRTVV
jgi:hypothetical protein